MKTKNKLNMGENEVKVFENEQFGQIRVELIYNEPWFVGKDVADALGYSDTAQAVRDHVEDEDKGVVEMTTPGGVQKMVSINESGFYSLVLSSRISTAKMFKRWVTSEVLPSIRKTGGYIATSDDMTDEEIMAKALMVAQTTIEKRNERIKQLENKVRLDSPKVGYFDALIDRGLNICFRDAAAKEIGVKQKKFIAYLIENKYVYRNKAGKLRPHADYDNDLFVVKDTKSDSNGWAGVQTLVTPKGKETFRVLLNA